MAGWLLCLALEAQAFVLMGPLSGQETTDQTQFNLNDEMGTPKDIDRGARRFWRWNQPYFVYSFDASFVGYFGSEGMNAVHEAVNVVNDFFENEDYSGMGELDLSKHGFMGNYNTTWINSTAANAQIIDIKTLTLGMLVNHLGVGNPHRHMFTGVQADLNNTVNFRVGMRNYDPISQTPTDTINGVKYSYRLIHNGLTIGMPAGGLAIPGTVDFEEFTTDTTGNAWSSTAAIADAFYGNTQLFWTDTPSLFNFGVYYDGNNAMGGQFRPRHALTYDDAGALKYLYATNNYVFETLDQNDVVLVQPAIFVPDYFANNLSNPTGRQFPIAWPRRGGVLNGGLPSATLQLTTPIAQVMANLPSGLQTTAMRGGINKIQFFYQPFDSLLGQTFTQTNFVWTDTFLWKSPVSTGVGVADASGNRVGSVTTRQSGIQWSSFNPNLQGLQFFPQPTWGYETKTQKLGRSVTEPDLLFVASELGTSADGVPIGWSRDVPVEAAYIGANGATYTQSGNYSYARGNSTEGPGIFSIGAAGSADATSGVGGVTGLQARYAFAFTRGLHEDFEVIWSGEASVVGNMEGQQVFWGHITGPGPNDLITFPQKSLQWKLENSIIPDTASPSITMVSDSGGGAPIEQNTLTRTEEVLTIIGDEMASVTAIEVMSGDLVVQTIMPVDKYIVSNTRIDIPVGIIDDGAEGAARQIRVWNSVGVSEKSTQKFAIETGLPVITSTTMDGFVWDRAETLTVRGYGFKSTSGTEKQITFLRIDDAAGAAVFDEGVHNNGGARGTSNGTMVRITGIEVLNDNMFVLPINAVTTRADGSNRRLRVSREYVASASDLSKNISPANNPLVSAITSKPVVSSLWQLQADNVTWENISTTGMYKRDRVVEINGTALNTATTLEMVQQDGTSFPNPVFIQLPNAAVSVDDNGTRIQVGANAIPYSDADTNSTSKRAFKVYNAVGNTDLDTNRMFAVNIKPVVDAIGGFSNPGYFNRDKTMGDVLAIYGTGFLAVDKVVISNDNDSSQNTLTIDLPSNGITVTDTSIIIDNALYQIGNAADTDVNATGGTEPRRIVKLTSARSTTGVDSASPLSQRFYVGAPPIIDSSTPFTDASGRLGQGHYTRDNATIIINGGNLGHITKLEIVDKNGNPIAGVPGLISGADGTGGTGLSIHNATALGIANNASGWLTTTHLLDSVGAATRRIRITTPFGVVTSLAANGFTISATPYFMSTAQATFGGGGYTGDDAGDIADDNGTYDKSEGDLYINGSNFRGVAKIYFGTMTGGTFSTGVTDGNFTVDPSAPPAGFTFSADGTQVVISKDNLPASWIGIDNAAIVFEQVGNNPVAAGGNQTTATIQTQP